MTRGRPATAARLARARAALETAAADYVEAAYGAGEAADAERCVRGAAEAFSAGAAAGWGAVADVPPGVVPGFPAGAFADSEPHPTPELAWADHLTRSAHGLVVDLAVAARLDGASWAAIGAATGITKGAAQSKFGHAVTAASGNRRPGDWPPPPQTGPHPPTGWYPDPAKDAAHRYFDGKRWTAQTEGTWPKDHAVAAKLARRARRRP